MPKSNHQHLAWAFDVPYLVTWLDDQADQVIASVVRPDTGFKGAWADEPRTDTFPRELINDLGHMVAVEQMLNAVAPVVAGGADPVFPFAA